jgi:hypothetical protein
MSDASEVVLEGLIRQQAQLAGGLADLREQLGQISAALTERRDDAPRRGPRAQPPPPAEAQSLLAELRSMPELRSAFQAVVAPGQEHEIRLRELDLEEARQVQRGNLIAQAVTLCGALLPALLRAFAANPAAADEAAAGVAAWSEGLKEAAEGVAEQVLGAVE